MSNTDHWVAGADCVTRVIDLQAVDPHFQLRIGANLIYSLLSCFQCLYLTRSFVEPNSGPNRQLIQLILGYCQGGFTFCACALSRSLSTFHYSNNK